MILLIPEHNRMGFMLGIPGLCLQIAGNVLGGYLPEAMGGAGSIVTALVTLCGYALLIAGLCYVAMAKGYHWGLGFLGLLSCIGLLIIAVLPDKAAANPPPGAYPPYGPMPPPGGGWGPGWNPGPGGPPPPPNPYAPPGGPPQGGWGGGGWGGPPPQG